MGDEITGEIDLSPATRAELREIRRRLDSLYLRVNKLEGEHGAELVEHDNRLDKHDERIDRVESNLIHQVTTLADRMTTALGEQQIQLRALMTASSLHTETNKELNATLLRIIVHLETQKRPELAAPIVPPPPTEVSHG